MSKKPLNQIVHTVCLYSCQAVCLVYNLKIYMLISLTCQYKESMPGNINLFYIAQNKLAISILKHFVYTCQTHTSTMVKGQSLMSHLTLERLFEHHFILVGLPMIYCHELQVV